MSGGLAVRPWQATDGDNDEYAQLLRRLASGMRTENPKLPGPSPEPLPPPAQPQRGIESLLSPPASGAQWKHMHDNKEGVSYFLNPATGEQKSLKDALEDPDLSGQAVKALEYQEAMRKKGITGGK